MKKLMVVVFALTVLLLTACGTPSNDLKVASSTLYQTDKGVVSCIGIRSGSHYQAFDCNWSTLQKDTVDGSLRKLKTATILVDGKQRYCVTFNVKGGETGYSCDYLSN